MFSVHGDVEFADRAEKIAYNAMPAAWARRRAHTSVLPTRPFSSWG